MSDEPKDGAPIPYAEPVDMGEGGFGKVTVDEAGVVVLRWVPTDDVRPVGGVPARRWIQSIINHENVVVGYVDGAEEWRPIQQEEK